MKLINLSLKDFIPLTEVLREMEISDKQCLILDLERYKYTTIHATINKLRLKGMQFTTNKMGNDVYVWRTA